MIVDTCFLSFVTWIYSYVTLSFEYVTFVKKCLVYCHFSKVNNEISYN